MPNYPQHYVPVPIQLLQRSVYTQQPQAALIIVKAFPVYLTPSQAANLQSQSRPIHQDVSPRVHNVQMVHYNAAQNVPVYSTAQTGSVYTTAQPTAVYSTAQPPVERPVVVPANNYGSASNSGLFFAPPSNVQGDNYLNQLAQVVAQQYSKAPSNFKAPAIIAGLENFSPEQQKLIKNHLNNYVTSHADGEKQEKDAFEHREISRSSDESQGKYSSKISSSLYQQQSDWRPAHQPSSNKKN